jgi:hydrogenase small subunit
MAITEISILWLTAGLSCDGDTISMTGATQPSLEDLLAGAIPWTPKVKLYNAFLATEVGDEFVEYFRRGARGELDPFILVVEGSIPNESNKAEGYWATFGTDPVTKQPITTCEWIDRLAPKAWAVVAAGTCAAYGGIHAMAGNPTGCMGLPDYLGWGWKSVAGIPLVISSTKPRVALPRSLWTNRSGPDGSSSRRCTKAVTGADTTSKATSPRSTAPPNAL